MAWAPDDGHGHGQLVNSNWSKQMFETPYDLWSWGAGIGFDNDLLKYFIIWYKNHSKQ